MQLVAPVDLLPPSICIICQTQPDGDSVVDTLQDLKTGVATPLNGRKYVCERCVGEFARLLGYEKGDDIQRAQVERQMAFDEIANVRARVTEVLQHVANFVNSPGITVVDEAPAPEQSPAEVRVEVAKAQYADVFGPPAEPTESPAPADGVERTVSSKAARAKKNEA